jgi:hypothetical protein
VQLPRNPQFDEEQQRFSLRFCCEDCGFFEQATERCRHDWPNEKHRADHVGELLIFCKEFELC